jgi:uncharacterized protein YhjY with autotransporter beta-barrel domain
MLLHNDIAPLQNCRLGIGVIEGVWSKNRMDITRTRSSQHSAVATLKLRLLKDSGDLMPYLAFRFKQEHESRSSGNNCSTRSSDCGTVSVLNSAFESVLPAQ